MLKNFIPGTRVNSIHDINLDQLYKQGVRGIITDLDNTLVGAKVALPSSEVTQWFAELKERGFQVVIVSNNRYERVRIFSEPLGIPFIHKAKKPTNKAFREGLRLMALQPNQAVVIGDQLLTDVLGGNRMGLHTVLVTPIALQDEGRVTRFNRRIERILMGRLKRKGHIPQEEKLR